MYYISHEIGDKYGVASTADGTVDEIDKIQLNQLVNNSGVKISSWKEIASEVNSKLLHNNNYKLWRKILSNLSDIDMTYVVRSNCYYSISDACFKAQSLPDYDINVKLFPYNEVLNYILFTITLVNKSVLVFRIDSNYNIKSTLLPSGFVFKQYPSCAGSLILRLAMRHGIVLDGINPEAVYLMGYSKLGNELYLVEHSKIGVSCIQQFVIPSGIVLGGN